MRKGPNRALSRATRWAPPLLAVLLLAPPLAGCINLPAAPPRTTEDLSIEVASANPSDLFVLYLPVLLLDDRPAPPVTSLGSSSADVAATLTVLENRSMLRIAGRGNATLTSHRELGRSHDFETYAWSTLRTGPLAPPQPTIEVLRENVGAFNATVRVDLHFVGSISDGMDFARRDAQFEMEILATVAWQEFSGADGLVVS